MDVIVKNTFLDIADHKFLCFEEPCCTERRCHSVPRSWKPVTPCTRHRLMKRSPSMVSNSSTQSDLSSWSYQTALSNSEDGSVDGSVKSKSNTTNATNDPDACHACVVSTPTRLKSTLTGEFRPFQPMHSETRLNTITRLKGKFVAFRPMGADMRFDAIANAVYLALVSCGQTYHIEVEKGLPGISPTLISAELHSGPRSSYDAIHLARQALEAVIARLDTVALVSKRVQKEDNGYSLRSSVACIPASAKDNMCWDLFNTGCCPRRCQCQWYHPQESDMGRFKVSIRSSEEVIGFSREDQVSAGLPAVRQQISLGELVF